MNRLLRAAHEYLADAVLVLVVVTLFLSANAILPNWTSHAQAVDVSAKLVGTSLALLGAIATYRRFFKGKTFSPRLRLTLSHRSISKTPNGDILHGLDIEAENIGCVTVWEPRVHVRVRLLYEDTECSVKPPDTDKIETSIDSLGMTGIEPGETAVFHYRFEVPNSVDAFRIGVEIVMDERHVWHRATTVRNAAPAQL